VRSISALPVACSCVQGAAILKFGKRDDALFTAVIYLIGHYRRFDITIFDRVSLFGFVSVLELSDARRSR